MTSRLVQRCCLVGVALLFANGAAAQSQTADVGQEVTALRAEVEQLRAELQELRTLVAGDRTAGQQPRREGGRGPSDGQAADPAPAAPGQQAVDPQASLEVLRTQVAEMAEIKVESASRMP